MGRRGVALVAAVVAVLLMAAPASAVTSKQYGAECSRAWHGKRTTKSFKRYKRRCIPSIRAAAENAADHNSPLFRTVKQDRLGLIFDATGICEQAFRRDSSGRRHFAGQKPCVKAAIAAMRHFVMPAVTSHLNGPNEPGGDADGIADAQMQINLLDPKFPRAGMDMSFDKIGTITAVDIHRGSAGTTGPVVLQMHVEVTATGGSIGLGCTDAHQVVNPACVAALRDIHFHAANYYVEVHTNEFPNGAIRGQFRPGRKTVLG